jgi:hypothetical protein
VWTKGRGFPLSRLAVPTLNRLAHERMELYDGPSSHDRCSKRLRAGRQAGVDDGDRAAGVTGVVGGEKRNGGSNGHGEGEIGPPPRRAIGQR